MTRLAIVVIVDPVGTRAIQTLSSDGGEVTLRERAAGPGLQVLLEAHGVPLGSEFDGHHQ